MCKKNESGRRRKVGGKNDVGRRTKELASFHGVCVASTKGAGLARRGNSAVHRRSPSIRVYDQQNPGGGRRKREQDDAKDRERRASMGRVLRRINYK